jgi:hypothetical protein
VATFFHTEVIFDSLVTIAMTMPINTNGRGSIEQVNTNDRPAALVWFGFTAPASAGIGSVAEAFLLRHNGAGTPIGDDSWAGVEVNLTIRCAAPLGVITVITPSEVLRKTYDTRALGPLGNNWGIGLRNTTNGAWTVSDLTYRYYRTENVF